MLNLKKVNLCLESDFPPASETWHSVKKMTESHSQIIVLSLFVCLCVVVCAVVCLQPVRVRVCWSAGTVSASLLRFAATEKTTVKTAAMKSTAAEIRVRRLSASHPSHVPVYLFLSVHKFICVCFPAQGVCAPGQPSCISASCPSACAGGNAACDTRNTNNCSESAREGARRLNIICRCIICRSVQYYRPSDIIVIEV